MLLLHPWHSPSCGHHCNPRGSQLEKWLMHFSLSSWLSTFWYWKLGSREARPIFFFFFVSYHLSQADLELAILVCHPLTYMDYRQTPQCLSISAGKSDRRISEAHQPAVFAKSVSSWFSETLSQKLEWRAIEVDAWHDFCPPHMHVHMCTYVLLHICIHTHMTAYKHKHVHTHTRNLSE